MRPTVEWLNRAFAVYNNRYFGGKLPMPKIIVSDNCTYDDNGVENDAFGYYLPDARYNYATRRITRVLGPGTLCLTTKWSRDVNDVVGTLLHEMIHMYIYLVLRINPHNAHGAEFMSIAKYIEADGWDVTSDDIKKTDTTGKDKKVKKEERILCLIVKPKGKNYKYWCCICDKKTSNMAYLAASKIQGVSKIVFYQCNSKNIEFFKMNPSKLTGFGAMTLAELSNSMAQYFNEPAETFNFKKMKQL